MNWQVKSLAEQYKMLRITFFVFFAFVSCFASENKPRVLKSLCIKVLASDFGLLEQIRVQAARYNFILFPDLFCSREESNADFQIHGKVTSLASGFVGTMFGLMGSAQKSHSSDSREAIRQEPWIEVNLNVFFEGTQEHWIFSLQSVQSSEEKYRELAKDILIRLRNCPNKESWDNSGVSQPVKTIVITDETF